MCVRETGHILVLVREIREIRDNVHELSVNYFKRVTHYDDVGVVADVARGRTEVNDPLCLRADETVSVNVGHYVMSHFLFAGFGSRKIYVVDIGFELRDLLLGYAEPELHLRAGERSPQSAECRELLLRGKDVLHLLACVACAERAFVGFVLCHFMFLRCVRF